MAKSCSRACSPDQQQVVSRVAELPLALIKARILNSRKLSANYQTLPA